ncbi:MAG: DEAD/DEAH box helicase [archaeon]|nr:DEAD/DEAH box helicase [archaeon]
MDVKEIVKAKSGFDSFNPMQEKAYSSGLLEKSMVVSAPTSSGKTVVAEMAALNSILNNGKKVVYTCPLRALASEHSGEFKRKYADLGIKGVLSTGDFDSSGKFLSQKDIIFTTFEKLNSLINHRADWLSEIGLLIVDEVHSLGSDRGPTLEMVITKLRFLNPKMHVLGLSATIPNAKELAQWLDAKLVESDFRPVVLKEGVFLDGSLHFGSETQKIDLESDAIVSLALDTLGKNKQALVFANTRRSSEAIAKKLAKITLPKLSANDKQALEKAAQKALNVLEQPTSQCKTISELIRSGTCFHNAGLLSKQREIVEDLFRARHLKFIASTTTLAAGINLPAFRVIIHSPYRYSGFGMERIPVSEYKQAAGRAGRWKYDTEGQSILIAKTEMEKDDYVDYYVNGEIEDVESKLENESALRFHLLAAIATGFIFDLDSAEKFFSKTFYAKKFSNLAALFAKITLLLNSLEEMAFIKTSEKRIDATMLGKRITELYLDPISANSMIGALRSEKYNPVAYLYMVVNTTEFFPLLAAPTAKSNILWEELQEGKSLLPINVDLEMFSDNNILSKYWTSKMLEEWISETKEQEIVESYKVAPGILRAKLQNADWLVYSALEIAKILEMEKHFVPLNKARKRLKSGIREELIPLCEFRGIGRVRARRMWNANIRSVADVKKVDIKDLEKVLSPKVAESVKAQLSMKK